MLDYLIVGLGLGGISFCETLEKNNKTFRVFNDESQQASKVAAGMYNPVILKRFTAVWKAQEQLATALPFYHALEEKLEVKLDKKLRVLRRFASVEEQNGWFAAADKKSLRPFLSTKIYPNKNQHIDAPLGFGEVLGTGKVDCGKLLFNYNEHLKKSDRLVFETFDFDRLQLKADHIIYKDVKARQIVFAEGFGLKRNPFFNYLPLTGTKGEYVVIKAPELKEDNVIKASVFIIPEGNDLYRVGATYKWKDKKNDLTEASKLELLKKLNVFLKCEYQVVDQLAGIRPTVTDRRPLVGRHPEHQNLYMLNGFGSRGVMIGPWASQQLFGFIEDGTELHPEMDIARFIKKYF